ncbi:MAG: YfcE family phosphodiesterase [Peptococcaceae bacterium]|nr:YfcE family phosphodiesterase [Peptococcaceae bacterium]
MKLLVMSDSHRNIDNMLNAVAFSKPDAIVHLGDHITDAFELQRHFPEITFFMVIGNCDYHTSEETELFFVFEGVKIYMTRGHMFGVKISLDSFIDRACRKGADIALYGHTHQALIQHTSKLWIMNPGQMARHDRGFAASYGLVTVDAEGGAFKCELVYLPV